MYRRAGISLMVTIVWSISAARPSNRISDHFTSHPPLDRTRIGIAKRTYFYEPISMMLCPMCLARRFEYPDWSVVLGGAGNGLRMRRKPLQPIVVGPAVATVIKLRLG